VSLNLRPDFRTAQGPGDFNAPVDPPPTLTDFRAALAAHQVAFHEDEEDRLNADGTWGGDPWGYGGSGIAFGYSSSDIDAVLVAEQGCWARPVKYDYSHWIRQIRYSIAAWDMTHDPKFARRLVAYDNMACGQFTDDPATIHLDDPGWIPFTLAQYHAMAQQRPGTGLPADYLRAMAWIGYGKAMRLKIDRKALHSWAEMYLETCALAAHVGTGQMAAGYTSTFHEALLVHAVLCLCHRLKMPTPQHVYDMMGTIRALPQMDYYGALSPVRFWKTAEGAAVVGAPPGQQQQGDPAFGYWSTNCVAMRDPLWLDAATWIGPTANTDENSRKLTLLWRGATK